MAAQSMTGYGKAEEIGQGYSVTVELKSVNNRFLEFQARTSRDLLFLEPSLKQELGRHITRGSVACHVQYDSSGAAAAGLTLNPGVLAAYSAMAKEAQAKLGVPCTMDLADLLKLPDVVVSTGTGEPQETVSGRILPIFSKACRELVAMREKEGGVLSADMESRIRAFFPALEKVKSLIPQRQGEYVSKMRARVQELAGESVLSEDRIMTELGLMAERLDVTEEMVRLEAHLHHFLETLASHKGPGKRLGFLLQEMLREVNTLGTKSQYSDIQHTCVGWKEELEVIREQIQNIE